MSPGIAPFSRADHVPSRNMSVYRTVFTPRLTFVATVLTTSPLHTTRAIWDSVVQRIALPVRVEPKVFFANE